MVKKEFITDKQKIAIMVFFLTGSISIFALGLDAKRDAWIAIILASFFAIPIVYIYVCIHRLFPDKDLFDIVRICFGRLIGNCFIIIFIAYMIFWAADVLNNYSKFMTTISFNLTPEISIIICLVVLCVFELKKGIVPLGAGSELFMFIPAFVLLFIIIFSSNFVDIKNIQPMLADGFNPILKGAFSVSISLTQIVAFTMVFSDFETKKSPSQVYFTAFIISSVYLFLLTLINILSLGEHAALQSYYPTYETLKKIHVRTVLVRIEALISIAFLLGGFVKICILMLCACTGISKLFDCKDYKFIVIPVALIITNLAYFLYPSLPYYMEFNLTTWNYIFVVLQVFIPLFILISAILKNNFFQRNKD